MSDFKNVLDCCYQLLQTQITIAPYSFSLLSYLVGIGVLSIVVGFIKKLFS